MHDETNSPQITGHTVVDTHAAKVGTVTDVLFDPIENVPQWAIVKTGALSGEHFVPMAETYLDDEGRLVIPFDKHEVKQAPKVRGIHVIEPDTDRELRAYYGTR